MISLNAIVSRIESFAANHYFIKTFSFGKSADSLDIEKLGTYPALYLVYNGADYGEGTKTYNFELYLIDLPGREEEIEEQRKEAVSDSEQCLEDILADIESGGNIFLFDEDYNVENGSVLPVYATHSNVLAGALLDISISVPYDRSACNLPLDGVEPEGGGFTYARRGLLRMLTLNGATDVLSVNTIRVPNGTLTDNGNGDVTLSISGAGGGVSSVNEVEPDINGNIALTTDEIPEGDNLYFTDARTDARISAASVTDLSDVTSAGSGAIITTSERTQIGTNASGIVANASAIATLDGEAIKSVNSLLPTAGALTLDTDDIAEGGTNLYYTDARVDARVAALDLATESYVDAQVGNEESARISADSSLQGQINTLAGSVSTNATDISNLENGVGNVTSLNALEGDVTLSAGSNVTLNQVGNNIEISSSGGGGGGSSDSFSNIAVPSQNTIVADQANDTLNIHAGTGVELTTDAATDTLTIAVDATTTDISEGTNLYYTNARVDARVTALGLATTSYVDTEVGNEESARIAADTSLQTQINATASGVATNASNITALEGRVTTAEADIDALEAATHVDSLNGLAGAVTLSAGANVTLTQVGSDIEISSSGGGGGSDSFNTIAVPGQSSIVADHGNDTLNINAGAGVALTTNAGTDTLTIGTTISVNGEPADASGDISVDTGLIPEGTNLYYTEARVSANTDVAANTAKLAGIEAGAEVNVNADWNATSGDAEILNKPTIPDEIAQLAGTTDDLAEGQTNKYYTDTRVQTYLTAEKIRANYPTATYGGAFTLSSSDEQKFLICNSSSAFAVTIPSGLGADAEVLIYQAGTGKISITAGSGVTLRNTSNFASSTAEQYAIIGLKQIGSSNVWAVTGERTAL